MPVSYVHVHFMALRGMFGVLCCFTMLNIALSISIASAIVCSVVFGAFSVFMDT
jgi:hypothetical protein